MHLKQVDIHSVRNLKTVNLTPSPGINLIYGHNASGKTSILEAIYLLSHGRSFRTTNIRSVITEDQQKLLVFGKICPDQAENTIKIGIEKGPAYTQIRINKQTVNQTSRLAAYLPVQILNPEAHRLLEQGPGQRRKYLDWGLFHVEQSFHETWQKYVRLLKQRNAALRTGKKRSDVEIWDLSLAESAEALTKYRQLYIQDINPYLQDYSQRLIDVTPVFQYRQGWPRDMTYKEALTATLETDHQRGFTQYGPHRGDLLITDDGQPVQDRFSRGQQKLLVSAMRLAQIAHLKARQGQQSVVLVDDLAAELDEAHRAKLVELLIETGAQLFITSTEVELFNVQAWPRYKMFHVEHGQVSEVI